MSDEVMRSYYRIWRQNNLEKRREYERDYYHKHRKKILEKKREKRMQQKAAMKGAECHG